MPTHYITLPMRLYTTLILAIITILISFSANAQDHTPRLKVKPERMKAPTETEPALREYVKPTLPYEAETSGYCCFSVNVDATGKVSGSTKLKCSAPIFEAVSQRSLNQSIYAPAIRNGKNIPSTSVRRSLFFLTDENGKFIPDPEGLLGFRNPKKPNTVSRLCSSDLTS